MSIINPKNEQDIENIRKKVVKALGCIKKVNNDTQADDNFLFSAKLALSCKQLPPYYLLYFLFVDLLGFKNLGQFEKIAWSIPFDYKGKAYLLEHRKFGVCLLAHDPVKEEKEINEILENINNAIKIANPFFKYIAQLNLKTDKINVKNCSQLLYSRYKYFLKKYKSCHKKLELEEQKPPKIKKIGNCTQIRYNNVYLYKQERLFLFFAFLEAFFSWTEHVFVLLAVINGEFTTGQDVINFIKKGWAEKYKKVINISENESLYNELLEIKKLRNYITHGDFESEGKTFYFHSGAGAVPIYLNENGNNLVASYENKNIEHIEKITLPTIESFIKLLWSGERKNAKILIQEYGFDLILSYSTQGKYKKIIKNRKETLKFAENMCWKIDCATNMDF